MYAHVLMRDEKEGRKKQARSNEQTRQSNTAHPTPIHVHVYVTGMSQSFAGTGILQRKC